MVRLEIVMLSHLNDLEYSIEINPEMALRDSKFMRAVVFHNPDLRIMVEKEYVNWLYSEVSEGRWGNSYEEWSSQFVENEVVL